MSLERGPKIRTLTEIETLSSIEIWRQNIMFSLNCNEEFRPFLEDDFEWGKKSATRQYRSLTTDTSGTNQKTAAQKSALVDLLLSQIANWSPLIPRNDIIKDCASLNEVWRFLMNAGISNVVKMNLHKPYMPASSNAMMIICYKEMVLII